MDFEHMKALCAHLCVFGGATTCVTFREQKIFVVHTFGEIIHNSFGICVFLTEKNSRCTLFLNMHNN